MWLGPLHDTPETASVQQTTAMTDTFMEMDSVLSQAQTDVANYRTITGKTDLDAKWGDVRAQCDEALTHYMTLVADHAPPLRPADVTYGAGLLQKATDRLVAFQSRYAKQLHDGAAAITVAKMTMQQAQRVAQQAHAAYSALGEPFVQYTSVRDAVQQLDSACAQLTTAQTRSDYASMAQLAHKVCEAADHLNVVVASAPQLANDATTALSAVSTRIAASRTRLEKLPAIMSALLKEFPAASSADLIDNADKARELIAHATDCLARARSMHHNGDFEGALSLVRAARGGVLAEADDRIDEVLDRPQILRDIKADPQKCSKRVRFELHDAQMYAVNHKLTRQWGSVLDAQLKRIELLEDSLNQPRPDYWAYTNGLDKVNDFIQSVVEKMRG